MKEKVKTFLKENKELIIGVSCIVIGGAALAISLNACKGQKTLRNYFTFKVNGGEPPRVTIDGKKLAVVSCVYNWSTSTDTYAGAENTVLAGYLGADPQLRMFALNFTTGIANEI